MEIDLELKYILVLIDKNLIKVFVIEFNIFKKVK